jgi:hypothetical protein
MGRRVSPLRVRGCSLVDSGGRPPFVCVGLFLGVGKSLSPGEAAGIEVSNAKFAMWARFARPPGVRPHKYATFNKHFWKLLRGLLCGSASTFSASGALLIKNGCCGQQTR